MLLYKKSVCAEYMDNELVESMYPLERVWLHMNDMTRAIDYFEIIQSLMLYLCRMKRIKFL